MSDIYQILKEKYDEESIHFSFEEKEEATTNKPTNKQETKEETTNKTTNKKCVHKWRDDYIDFGLDRSISVICCQKCLMTKTT